MDKQTRSVTLTLTEDERSALQAICRRCKVDALVWKRARAFLLLDAGYDAKTICQIPAVSRAYPNSGAAYSNRTLATRNVTVLLSALGGVRPLAWRLPAYRQI